jgi:hypothetical protein
MTIIKAAMPATLAGAAVDVQFGDLTEYIAPVTVVVQEILGDQDIATMGQNFRREETYSIVVEITTWAGDQDYLQRFTDAMSCFNLILAAVGVNPWLSTSGLNDATAAVRFAEVGNTSTIPAPDDLGQSRCSLQFHVRCSARIDSLAALVAA